ncbi:MAG: LysM peptidoglycan-binding domain-containing protein [Defluviitaleaceae bacterium]|nr:LysM peptidoglycan-binding domain-containing protein [Defluviitaleaceae bacterium]
MALLSIPTAIAAATVANVASKFAQKAAQTNPYTNAWITIIIEYKGKEMLFPINPEEITIKRATNLIKYDVLELGEISLPNTPNLERITFTSQFWAERSPKNSGEYVNWLNEWRNEKEPGRIIIVNHDNDSTYHGLNKLVLCENFDTNEGRAGFEDDVYYTLNLVEFREKLGTDEITIEEDGYETAEPIRLDERPTEPPVYEVQPLLESQPQNNQREHEVSRGESLWSIAKKFNQPGTSWAELYAIPENRAIIGENPNAISPGQQLIIPENWR